MNDDLVLAAIARLESKMDTVDEKLDAYSPRVAVLEHRVNELEKASGTRGERRWQVWLAVSLAVLALVGSFVQPLIGG